MTIPGQRLESYYFNAVFSKERLKTGRNLSMRVGMQNQLSAVQVVHGVEQNAENIRWINKGRLGQDWDPFSGTQTDDQVDLMRGGRTSNFISLCKQ